MSIALNGMLIGILINDLLLIMMKHSLRGSVNHTNCIKKIRYFEVTNSFPLTDHDGRAVLVIEYEDPA